MAKNNSIRLDPKHGVNPSVMVCFYCGEDKGVALLGFQNGREAPRRAVYDKEPCDKCAEYMKQGVILISADPTRSESDNPYRTGGWVVVKDDAVSRLFDEATAREVLKHRVCFVEDEAWDHLGLPRGGA